LYLGTLQENTRPETQHMAKKQITISYEESTYQTLTDVGFKELIDTTILFSKNAYAPYSNFRVSAGLRLKNGTILCGANVENASYPVSICAERTLISNTIVNYSNTIIEEIVVYVDKDLNEPVPPCGMCRQALLEAEQRQKSVIKLSMVAKNGKILTVASCSDLLPWSFDGSYLE
jgi:cytidine deaminase